MKNSVQDWLSNRAALSGTLGCGVRMANGKCVCHSVEDSCPAALMEKLLAQFDHARATVADARWSTWLFDQGQIRFVERGDGVLLAVAARADTDATAKMDALSEEFLSLPLAG